MNNNIIIKRIIDDKLSADDKIHPWWGKFGMVMRLPLALAICQLEGYNQDKLGWNDDIIDDINDGKEDVSDGHKIASWKMPF